MPDAIPILLYHSVSDSAPPGQGPFTIRPSLFAEHVRAIAHAGRTAMTVAQLGQALRDQATLPARPVLITFDDGFQDVRAAVERLLGADLAASVFLISGWLGRERMLTPQEARDLAALGERVEIGAHSVAHPRLDEVSAARATREIAGCRAALQDMLAAPVDSFAYPHGAHDRHVRQAVVRAGYQAAAAVKNALSHSEDDTYALARWTVTSNTSAQQIAQLLAGRGAPLVWRGERARTRGYRILRRLRHRILGEASNEACQ